LTSYHFWLYEDDLTAENAENAEGDPREMNNSNANGFDFTGCVRRSLLQQIEC